MFLWDFRLSLVLFYMLLGLSIIAVSILLIAYQRERQNLPLRSSCVMMLAMYAGMVAGHFYHQGHAELRGHVCDAQAFILNYFYICIHAHCFFIMLNSCYMALGWRWRYFDSSRFREGMFILFAYTTPLLFVVLFSLMITSNPEAISIVPGAFYCSLVRPRLWLSTIWFMLFSIPGCSLAVYLLYRMCMTRMKMVKVYGTDTQFTIAYLSRYAFSTFVYLVLSLGTILPLFIVQEYDPGPIVTDLRDPSLPRSPWFHPQMCAARPSDPEDLYYFKLLCPGPLSFFPVIVGISFFLMFGFGTHARTAYRHYLNRIFRRSKQRRNSAAPLMDHSMSGGRLPGIPEQYENELPLHESPQEALADIEGTLHDRP